MKSLPLSNFQTTAGRTNVYGGLPVAVLYLTLYNLLDGAPLESLVPGSMLVTTPTSIQSLSLGPALMSLINT